MEERSQVGPEPKKGLERRVEEVENSVRELSDRISSLEERLFNSVRELSDRISSLERAMMGEISIIKIHYQALESSVRLYELRQARGANTLLSPGIQASIGIGGFEID